MEVDATIQHERAVSLISTQVGAPVAVALEGAGASRVARKRRGSPRGRGRAPRRLRRRADERAGQSARGVCGKHAGEAGQGRGNSRLLDPPAVAAVLRPLRRPGRSGARQDAVHGSRGERRRAARAAAGDMAALPPAEAILEVAARDVPTAAPTRQGAATLHHSPRAFSSGAVPRARWPSRTAAS